MKFFRKRRHQPPVMTREAALRCVPVKNKDIKELRLDNGTLRLCYPLLFKPWLVEIRRRFGPPQAAPPEKQLELDELGTLTWDLMDGDRRVADIVKRFSRQTQVHPKEAEAAVTQFIRELGKRGLVGLKQIDP